MPSSSAFGVQSNGSASNVTPPTIASTYLTNPTPALPLAATAYPTEACPPKRWHKFLRKPYYSNIIQFLDLFR